MKTVLLTGATGYIGQFAIRPLLEKNYIVHAVTSRPVTFEPTENIFWHQTNLLNFAETDSLLNEIRPTNLLHFAWYVEHGKFWNAAENLDWLAASLNLAKRFVENGGRRMVTSGTCAEYDWTSESPFSEHETPFCPQTLYGATKYALASTLEKYAQISDCSFASGKIFFPFGANESPNRLVPSVIRALLENRPARTSHGEQVRDFMYVEDVAKAFVGLLESDIEGAVNIASGKGVKLKEIVTTIADIVSKAELLEIGTIPASENEPPEVIADINTLCERVKLSESVSLKKRLKQTVEYWKETL